MAAHARAAYTGGGTQCLRIGSDAYASYRHRCRESDDDRENMGRTTFAAFHSDLCPGKGKGDIKHPGRSMGFARDRLNVCTRLKGADIGAIPAGGIWIRFVDRARVTYAALVSS